jgi:hypothetical protein
MAGLDGAVPGGSGSGIAMKWDLRKGVIGLASLGALLLVYLVYAWYSRTPEMALSTADQPQVPSSDFHAGNPGRIGGVDVGGVEGVTYEDRDERGRVYRQWGFGALWHRSDNIWEMKQPWVRLLMADATCVITADSGRFTLQSGQKDVFPTDALFSGHVVLQTEPREGSSLLACQVGLDDIAFTGSTSRFTSSGRIDFVSERLRWTGRQAEFVYNDQARRIEFFRLGHLDSMTLKVPKGRSPGGPGSATGAAASAGSSGGAAETPWYQCLLRDNVLVQTAQDAVFVQETLWLTDLTGAQPSEPSGRSPSAASGKGRPPSPKESPGDWTEVSIVCDGAVVVTPMGVALPSDPNGGAKADRPVSAVAAAKDAGRFSARTLHYNGRTGDAEVEGPVELNCFCNDFMDRNSPALIPVRMTAVQGATYRTQPNRITLEGPCLCTFLRTEGEVAERGSLAAPRLIVDLLANGETRPSVATRAVKTVHAEGGAVELRLENMSVKNAGAGSPAPPEGPVVSGARMVCTHLTLDPQQAAQVITATGPGTIWLNNSTTQGTGRLLDSNQPFYALLSQFEILQFFVADNRILASGKKKPMLVDYFPIVDGRQTSHIHAEADAVRIDLARTPGHERDLATLTATGNVYYDDETPHQFSGHTLNYDHRTRWMEVTGQDGRPCIVDGAEVWGVRYNVKTREGSTRVVAPIMGAR